MTLAQALKRKNKLVKKLNDLRSKVTHSNSFIIGNKPSYDLETVYNEFKSVQKELIDLKSKIMIANQPIQAKIFSMSELKSELTQVISQISVQEGKVAPSRFGSPEGTLVEYACVWNRIKIDELKDALESQIDAFQEDIDKFNHTTNI